MHTCLTYQIFWIIQLEQERNGFQKKKAQHRKITNLKKKKPIGVFQKCMKIQQTILEAFKKIGRQ